MSWVRLETWRVLKSVYVRVGRIWGVYVCTDDALIFWGTWKHYTIKDEP